MKVAASSVHNHAVCNIPLSNQLGAPCGESDVLYKIQLEDLNHAYMLTVGMGEYMYIGSDHAYYIFCSFFLEIAILLNCCCS